MCLILILTYILASIGITWAISLGAWFVTNWFATLILLILFA
jgi:hypothetical protein